MTFICIQQIRSYIHSKVFWCERYLTERIEVKYRGASHTAPTLALGCIVEYTSKYTMVDDVILKQQRKHCLSITTIKICNQLHGFCLE